MPSVPKPKRKLQKKRFQARRDPKYAAWIRGQFCCISVGYHWMPSFTTWGGTIQAAHVRSRGAAGDDRANLVPLCGDHHAEQHRVGTRSFEKKYGVNLKEEAERLWQEYQREHAA
jgi:hypothetical protein